MRGGSCLRPWRRRLGLTALLRRAHLLLLHLHLLHVHLLLLLLLLQPLLALLQHSLLSCPQLLRLLMTER